MLGLLLEGLDHLSYGSAAAEEDLLVIKIKDLQTSKGGLLPYPPAPGPFRQKGLQNLSQVFFQGALKTGGLAKGMKCPDKALLLRVKEAMLNKFLHFADLIDPGRVLLYLIAFKTARLQVRFLDIHQDGGLTGLLPGLEADVKLIFRAGIIRSAVRL